MRYILLFSWLNLVKLLFFNRVHYIKKNHYNNLDLNLGWTKLKNEFMYNTQGFNNKTCEPYPSKYICERGEHEHYQYNTLPQYTTSDFRIFDNKHICYIGDSLIRQMRVSMCHLPSKQYTNGTLYFVFSSYIFGRASADTLNLDKFEKKITKHIGQCDVVVMETFMWWNRKLGNKRGYNTKIKNVKYADKTMDIETFIKKYDKNPLEKGIDIIYANMTTLMKKNAKLYYLTEPTSPKIQAYQKYNLKNTETFKILNVSKETSSAPKGIKRLGPHFCSANSIPLLWNFILARNMKNDFHVSS